MDYTSTRNISSFFFWEGQFSDAVTVSGAGRIIFKQLKGYSF